MTIEIALKLLGMLVVSGLLGVIAMCYIFAGAIGDVFSVGSGKGKKEESETEANNN